MTPAERWALIHELWQLIDELKAERKDLSQGIKRHTMRLNAILATGMDPESNDQVKIKFTGEGE